MIRRRLHLAQGNVLFTPDLITEAGVGTPLTRIMIPDDGGWGDIPGPAPYVPIPDPMPAPEPLPQTSKGISPWVWVAGLFVAAILLKSYK